MSYDIPLNPKIPNRFTQRVDRTSASDDEMRYQYIKEGAFGAFQENYLADTKIFKGIVLTNEGGPSGNKRGSGGFLSRLPFRNNDVEEFVAIRVRIPELHAHIPEPCGEGTTAAQNRGIFEMHPLFVGQKVGDRSPSSGDIVEVSFNKGPSGGIQSDGIFHRIFQQGGFPPESTATCGRLVSAFEDAEASGDTSTVGEAYGTNTAPDSTVAVAFIAADESNFSRGNNSRDYIVIHTIQGEISRDGSSSWAKNPDANASAHYWVRSSDGNVVQMVKEADRAWHVGNANSKAIGIEHEGFVDDPARWYTDAMYRASANLTADIARRNNIPIDREHIMGHNETARIGYRGDHHDPGDGWNWDLYMEYVRDATRRQPPTTGA